MIPGKLRPKHIHLLQSKCLKLTGYPTHFLVNIMQAPEYFQVMISQMLMQKSSKHPSGLSAYTVIIANSGDAVQSL
jgi:hypothetical protein